MFVILDLTSFNSDRRGTLENTAKHIALKSQSSLSIHLTIYLFISSILVHSAFEMNLELLAPYSYPLTFCVTSL